MVWARWAWSTPLAVALAFGGGPLGATPTDAWPPPRPASAADDAAAALLPGAAVVGRATLRFMGVAVYDARLLALPGWHVQALGQQPIVLELSYRRAFRGTDIARRSLQEMQRAAALPEATHARWLATLQQLFPDVQPGDRIAGLWRPGIGARFVLTRADGRIQPLGGTDDAVLAERFFGIWLAPTTSEPQLRRALLGLADGGSHP